MIKYTHSVPLLNRPKITNPQDSYKIILPLFNQDMLNIREEAVAIYLNRRNRVIGGLKLSSGGISGTVVDIKLLLSVALKCLASGIILAHNHPSGELSPSKSDLAVTEQLKQAAKLIDISLLDHLILGHNSYYSFADEGLI